MSKSKEQQVYDTTIQTITRMVVDHPIIAAVLMKLRTKVVKDYIAIASVDCAERNLVLGEDVLDFQDPLSIVLIHEALHILNGTFLRRGNRNPILWNYATDLEINWIIKDMTGYEVKAGLYDPEMHEKHAEEIYAILEKQVDQQIHEMLSDLQSILDAISSQNGTSSGGSGSQSESSDQDSDEGGDEDQDSQSGKGKGGKKSSNGQKGDQNRDRSGSPSDGSLEDKLKKLNELQKKILKKLGLNENAEVGTQPEPLDDKTKEIVKQFVIEAALAAVQMQQMGIGKLPAGLERIIDGFTKSKVRWQDYLEDAVLSTMVDDYSYRKPYKPYMVHSDVYAPSICNPCNQDVIVMVDTSGSIGENDLRYFLTEVKALLDQYKVTFVACDAEVQAVVEDGDIDEIVKNVKGGGGTMFAPFFKWVEENTMDKPSVPIIIMTDGYNGDYEIERPWNVSKIITLTTTGKEPDGIESDYVIHMEVEKD